MRAITDALDRMDFWSREIVLRMQDEPEFTQREFNSLPVGERRLLLSAPRIITAIAIEQFQSAQEAAKLAQ